MGKIFFKTAIGIAFLLIYCFNSGCYDPDTKNSQPVCTITNPNEGDEYIKGQQVNIAVNADDEDIPLDTLTVQIYVDDINFATLRESPYSYKLNTSDDEIDTGMHMIRAVVTDSRDGRDEDSVNIRIISNNGEQSPNADFIVDPKSGSLSTVFSVDASVSSDPFDTITNLQVRWDWETDGEWDTDFAVTKTATHQYIDVGTYEISLKARNSQGFTDTTSQSVTVTTSGNTGCKDVTEVEYQGKTYQTVEIGNQCWLKQNLDVGVMINGSKDQEDNGTIEKYCYENNTDNCDTYGALYQWDEMMKYTEENGIQGICPDGWHIPTDTEWKALEMRLGMTQAQADQKEFRGDDEGGKLKEEGGDHWKVPNKGATNASGFTALGAGNRNTTKDFTNQLKNAYFWTSTVYDNARAWHRNLYYDNTGVYRFEYHRNNAFSVRCLKDSN
ncbi:MAG: hypothetical protein K9I94_10390 [Bacteroidales bacterium]|nr:hypothetical protein [Bacteroidales bacterium]